MKVLVTGAGGNVGHWVLRRLVQEPDLEIVGYDVARGEEHAGVEWVEGDILDVDTLGAAMRDVETVIHLAAIPVYYADRNLDIGRINVLGAQHVLEAATQAGARRFIQASSICATGFIFASKPIEAPYLPIDEAFPTTPDDMYGVSKLVDEQLARAYESRYGIETTSLRMASVWDPESELSKHEVAYLLKPEVDGDLTYSDLRWAYVDVRDVAQAFLLALRHLTGLGPCNVGAADTPGGDCGIWLEDVFADVPCRAPLDAGAPLWSIAKLSKATGYSPEHSWREYPSFLEAWPSYLERRAEPARS